MALSSQGNLAGLARVAFQADTGEFNADVQRAEATYRDATRGMSDEAVRLELSQDRLRRELAKGPANYRAIARAELEVRRSEASLRGENARLERQFDETRRAADRMGRGIVSGSGALRGMGRNLAYASAGFLGGAGLVYGMRNAIAAASNLEEQTNKVRVVFGAGADEVIRFGQSTATSIGLASDQALQAAGDIGNMVTALGVGEGAAAKMSIRMVQLAADMASFNNEDPSDMLERIRSGLSGELEPLRRFGSVLSAARVEQFAWANGIAESGKKLTEQQKILARYGLLLQDTTKQHGDFERTSEGLANSQRTLSALWREANILLGQALAPAFTDVVKGLRDWLAEDKNREEIQRTINRLVKDGEGIVRGLASALEVAKDAAEPLVDALGGVAGTVEKITLVWLAMKAKAVLSFGATALASRTTSAKMIADATAAGRAWDVATRPRVMSVTTVGGGVPGPGAPVPAGRGTRIPPVLVGNPALLTVAAILATSGASGAKEGERRALMGALYEGKLIGEFPLLTAVAGKIRDGTATESELAVFKRLPSGGGVSGEDLADGFRRAEREMKALYKDKPWLRGTRGAPGAGRTGGRPAPAEGAGGGGGRGPRPFTIGQYERQLAAIDERAIDAAATPGQEDDVRVAQARLALARRALRELELTRDQRVQVKQQRNAALAELARIEQEDDQAAAQRRDEAQEKARKAREARAKRIRERIDRREGRLLLAEEVADDTEKDLQDNKRALIALRKFYGQMAQNDQLTLKERQDYASKRRAVRRRLQKLYRDAVDEAIDDDRLTKKERARLRALGGADLVRRAERGLRGKDAGDDDKPLTAAEVARMQVQFLTGLHGVLNQFGGNVGQNAGDFGMQDTQLQLQTLELQNQTKIMAEWSSSMRHPGAQFARTELTTAAYGYGF